MYSELKATQIAAIFLRRIFDCTMHRSKLLKLLYLTERESIYRNGVRIIGDKFVSTPSGPMLVHTYELMNGLVESNGEWNLHLVPEYMNLVKLNTNVAFAAVMSTKELCIVDSVWKKFGDMSAKEIENWMKTNCAEWKDPEGSIEPIRYYDVARAVGFNEEISELLEKATIAQWELSKINKLLNTAFSKIGEKWDE